MLSLPSLNLALDGVGQCVNQSCAMRGLATYNCSDGRVGVTNASNCSDLCANASNGDECAVANFQLCEHVVCEAGNCSNIQPFVPPSCDDGNICTVDTCDVCANNCSGACVNTASNSSSCNLPEGDPCFSNGQCTTDFCVDGVCCDSACTDPLHGCNVPGSVGHCVSHAPAPLVSARGLAAAAGLLGLVGLLSLRRVLRS